MLLVSKQFLDIYLLLTANKLVCNAYKRGEYEYSLLELFVSQ